MWLHCVYYFFHCIRKSQQQTWDITVKATDGASPSRESPGYQLRIHVTDGLQAPQLRSSFTASIDEDEQVGYTVQDISPQQKNPNYKYSILSGNTDKAFCINHAGVISVARPLDREKISSYSLKVSASVGSKISNSTVTVVISDRNDDTPKFTKTVYSFDVSEDKRKWIIVYVNIEVGAIGIGSLSGASVNMYSTSFWLAIPNSHFLEQIIQFMSVYVWLVSWYFENMC